MSKGLTNREVAEKLIVSQRLVEYDLTNIHQKLRAKSRTKALTKATKYKLLDTIMLWLYISLSRSFPNQLIYLNH